MGSGIGKWPWVGFKPGSPKPHYNHINFNHNQSSHHKCLAGIFVMNEVTLAANNISKNRKLCLKSDKNSTLCIAVAKTAEEFKTIISFIPFSIPFVLLRHSVTHLRTMMKEGNLFDVVLITRLPRISGGCGYTASFGGDAFNMFYH